MNALVVFLVALATALATGLGVLPLLWFRVDKDRSLAISGAIAAGFMLGASAGLFYEGVTYSSVRTIVGALVGTAFIVGSRALIGQSDDPHIGSLRGARGLNALLIIGIMTVHSFTEGAAIGVSLAGEASLGALIAIAIAVHNIPEGLAISLSLVPYGERPLKAAGWSIFSSLPQPLMAVPAYLAVRAFQPLLPAGLGFAGGAMIWLVATQLLPEVLRSASRRSALAALVVSALAMILLEAGIGF